MPACRRFGRLGWSAVVLGCILAAGAPATLAEPIEISFLSGYVYLDSNKNASMDHDDWAIQGAAVELLKAGDPGFRRATTTDEFAFYSFEGLEAGTYTIRQVTRAILDGTDNLGILFKAGSNQEVLPLAHHGLVGDDAFTDVVIGPEGARGFGYNFGERIYPIELISKQMLLTTAGSFQRCPDPWEYLPDPVPDPPPDPVPEPGVLLMLAVAWLAVAVFAARGRRRRTP